MTIALVAIQPGGAGATSINLSQYPGVDSSGATDSTAAVTAAMAQISGSTTTLVVDCPVLLDVNYTPTKPIFVRSGTNLYFTPLGKFICTNAQLPTFVFLGVSDCTWYNTRITWTGTNPVDYTFPPYNSVAANFNNVQMLNWMNGTATGSPYTGNPVVFSGSGATPLWAGPGDASAIFIIRGGCNRLRFFNTTAYVADTATAPQFIQEFCSYNPNWSPGQTVTSATNPSNANCSMPTNIIWDGFSLDGAYMGFVGSPGSWILNDAKFYRYSLLQDANGNNQGGGQLGTATGGSTTTIVDTTQTWTVNAYAGLGVVNMTNTQTSVITSNTATTLTFSPAMATATVAGNQYSIETHWLSPPHAIYTKSYGNPGVLTSQQKVTNVYDYGIYVGTTARTNIGGFLNSLKIEPANGSVVEDYTSLRPDGGVDVLSFGNAYGKLNNIYVEFNSTIYNPGSGPSFGMQFPSSPPVTNLYSDNVTIIDLATVPEGPCVESASTLNNSNCSFTTWKLYQNDWPTGATYYPGFGVVGNNNVVQFELCLNECNSTQTIRGPIAVQLNSSLNSSWDCKLLGWRLVSATLSAALSSGATTASLASNWAWSTGTYRLFFSDGQTWRDVTLTNGATTISAFAALGATQTIVATASGLLANTANFNGYRPRVLLGTGNGASGNRARILDLTNSYEAISDNNLMTETFSQEVMITPTSGASSYATTIIIPATFSVEPIGWLIETTLGNSQGLTGVNVGWSGSTSALLASAPIVLNTNIVYSPAANPISVGGSNQTVLLTAIGGTFDGTGSVVIIVRAKRYSVSG